MLVFVSRQSQVVASVDLQPKRTLDGIAGHATNWSLHLRIYNSVTSSSPPKISGALLWYIQETWLDHRIKMIGLIGADNDNTCHGNLEALISWIHTTSSYMNPTIVWRSFVFPVTPDTTVPTDLPRLSAIQRIGPSPTVEALRLPPHSENIARTPLKVSRITCCLCSSGLVEAWISSSQEQHWQVCVWNSFNCTSTGLRTQMVWNRWKKYRKNTEKAAW